MMCTYVTRRVSEEVGVVECGFRRPISVSYTLRYVRLIGQTLPVWVAITDAPTVRCGLERRGKKKDEG
jgi:hypothetical protein